MRKKKACLKRHATILPLLYRMPTTIVNYYQTHRQRRGATKCKFALRPHSTRHLLLRTTHHIPKRNRLQERRLQCNQKSLFDLDLYETIYRRSRYMPARYNRHHILTTEYGFQRTFLTEEVKMKSSARDIENEGYERGVKQGLE